MGPRVGPCMHGLAVAPRGGRVRRRGAAMSADFLRGAAGLPCAPAVRAWAPHGGARAGKAEKYAL